MCVSAEIGAGAGASQSLRGVFMRCATCLLPLLEDQAISARIGSRIGCRCAAAGSRIRRWCTTLTCFRTSDKKKTLHPRAPAAGGTGASPRSRAFLVFRAFVAPFRWSRWMMDLRSFIGYDPQSTDRTSNVARKKSKVQVCIRLCSVGSSLFIS